MYKKVILFLVVSSFFILTSCSDTFIVTPSVTHVTIEPSVAQNVESGGTISFTVTADNGYTLSSTVGGTCPQGSWTGTIYTTGIITADCTVDFNASANITVTPSGTHVTIDPSTEQSIASNGTASFTVIASSGYVRSSTVDGTCTSGTWDNNIYTTGAITSDCTVIFSASISLKIFVTASGWDGRLGQGGAAITLAAIDALCMADANKPTDGGTYKAMFATAGAGQVRTACTTSSCSTGAGENVNWVMKPNTDYYRADGTTLIGITNSGGVFPLDQGQSLSDSISGVNEWYWTGFEGYVESGGN
ncbi:MAG: DUF1554 domain-containing protein, partial [Proteobacteria bacterium]|nr:DUF1554 domain-containing protein [Pseudomonadota bacterium]